MLLTVLEGSLALSLYSMHMRRYNVVNFKPIGTCPAGHTAQMLAWQLQT